MTFTQLLLSAILILTFGLAGHGLRLGLGHKNLTLAADPKIAMPASLWAGDFVADFRAAPGERLFGLAVVTVLLLCIGSAVLAAAWGETHPDRRTAYGRAYEECVSERQLNRWLVDQVRKCVSGVRPG